VDVALVEELMMVEGRFYWRNDLSRYVFNNMEKLEKIVASRKPDIAVNTMAECIDDFRPSHSILDGNRVAVGVVCYQALTQTVVHEETGSNGDIAQTWAGHISPAATPSELSAAKKAWLQVLKDKTYGFL